MSFGKHLSLSGLIFSVFCVLYFTQCSSKPYETITTDRVEIPRAAMPDESLKKEREESEQQVVEKKKKPRQQFDLHLPREVFHAEIRTPLLYPFGMPLQPPVLQFGSGAQLKLSFDRMDLSYSRLAYRFVHCDRNWEPSPFQADEFLDGTNYFYFETPGTSRGTLTPFTHYSTTFPNDHTKFRYSGNYLIEVFHPDNPEEVLLRAGFMVAEQLMDVKVEFSRPSTAQKRLTHQALRIKAQKRQQLRNLSAENISMTVYQNFRPDNVIYGIEPKFTRGDEIVFTEQNDLLFPGGREYRQFDTRERDGSGVGIARSDMSALFRNYTLLPEEIRAHQLYRFRRDANGFAVIGKSRNLDPYLEADYAQVTFLLKSSLQEMLPLVTGNWSMWNGLPLLSMRFKDDEKLYFVRALLKEGHYDYKFWHLEHEQDTKPENLYFEGNRYETENAYQIFIYYRDTGSRFDRIVAYKKVRTVN